MDPAKKLMDLGLADRLEIRAEDRVVDLPEWPADGGRLVIRAGGDCVLEDVPGGVRTLAGRVEFRTEDESYLLVAGPDPVAVEVMTYGRDLVLVSLGGAARAFEIVRSLS